MEEDQRSLTPKKGRRIRKQYTGLLQFVIVPDKKQIISFPEFLGYRKITSLRKWYCVSNDVIIFVSVNLTKNIYICKCEDNFEITFTKTKPGLLKRRLWYGPILRFKTF